MRLLWWNTYRYGASTDAKRKLDMKALIDQVDPPPEAVFLCELTPQCADPKPLQYVYRRKNPYQLCYGVESTGMIPSMSPQLYTPSPSDCYRQVGYKGGNDFTRIASRAPGIVTLPDGTTPAYFFHAPASNNAVKTLAYLACDLDRLHRRNPWVLLGDFNVEPDTLGAQNTGVVIEDLIKRPDRATYKKKKAYDYALSNLDDLKVVALEGHNLSDHDPILITT